MKKRIAHSVLFMLLFLSAFAQQPQYVTRSSGEEQNADEFFRLSPKNEIRLNLFQSVLGLPEINYERIIDENFGLGFAAAVSLEDVQDSNLRSLFLVYGRLYLGNNKPATGFYIEGNTGLVLQKATNYYSNYNNNNNYNPYTSSSADSKTYSGLGIGVAAGYKFITKNDWVGEFSLGVGRVFGNRVIDAYPRVGITIGKRF